MADGVSIVASVLAAAFGGGLAVTLARAADLRRRLADSTEEATALRGLLGAAQQGLAAARSAMMTNGRELEEARGAAAEMARRIDDARHEDEKKAGWLDHQQEEIDWLRAELEKRPKITRKTYKIVTVGMKWTGKTSLTLKWANPLVDLGMLQGTKIERYERTVSHVAAKDVTTEHVFEIGDWGGEHMVDAQQELIMDEIHGMLIVVDLGGKDAKTVEPARVQQQLREFQPESLKFFFGPKTVASCKAVVLFINKSDLIAGTPAEAEIEARRLYARLIDDLMRYKEQVDIRVFVGSASYGHSTHMLFSHFVEKILPKNAYDNQLLQRLKTDPPAVREKPVKAPPLLHAKA
ncbi:Hypothetical protein A7982_11240 [Minicystis rosea]|nr:Hypothetical protein A7982_11240 [Minicystis rosea]